MNARQFINTVVSAGLEKSAGVRATLYLLPQFLFPEFLKRNRLTIVRGPFRLAAIIYVIVFILVFVVQATFAWINGVLWVPKDVGKVSCFLAETECLQYFFGDYANLLNYVVLVEAYCISGVFFLIHSSNIDRQLLSDDIAAQLNLSEPAPSKAHGAYSILFLVFFVTLFSALYAIDIHSYPPHWYMNVREAYLPSGQTLTGAFDSPEVKWQLGAHYNYVFINYLLLMFVGFVGLAHFGLFKAAGAISAALRDVRKACGKEELEALLDSKKVNTWLAPLATQTLISKVFVLAIVLNMTSWRMWESKAGIIQDIAIVIMVVVGVWIITLPRYFIQYHLFRIRQKCGVDEYRDIQMSWMLGASALADLALVTIAAKILFSAESIFEMIGDVLTG